ncbi:methyltransferase [Fundidesulfovibrio putealis]|uniref:methyltransferase n=1 Tax=Fundidesulfovibrio putealis TaxID=270496 RepID=UPI00146F99A8|nr:methyltransferase [Fundidesulfovibrio putealis]
MSRPEFDEFAANYDEIRKQSLGYLGKDLDYYARAKSRLVRRMMGDSVGSILEFGCGIGSTVAQLRLTFPRAIVAGCDLSLESLSIARTHNPDVHFFSLSEEPPIKGGFDAVVVPNVFHHVAPGERNQVLDTIYEMVSPGGSIIVFEHNPYNPLVRRVVKNCPLDRNAVLLPLAESLALVRRRFTLSAHGYTTFFPPVLSCLAILEPLLGWVPLGGQYYVRGIRDKHCAAHKSTRDNES